MHQTQESGLCIVLVQMMLNIVNHVFRDHKMIRERLEGVMKGNVYKLWKDEIEAKGKAEGELIGRVRTYQEFGVPVHEIAEKLGLSEDTVSAVLYTKQEDVSNTGYIENADNKMAAC